MSDDPLKIAVFIDFDNIEIGVRTSLGSHFEVGAVLEAVKERGEVVTKVAYGDWTRATDYGRSMSQHAIHMVQRNLTPGGDKNGADINLALDALEMAFTHNHINAFVIVGGDSDFITLVEKLKQYDRKVFVVGGRSFTSQVMQKNCTEFVAYEDIVGVPSRGRQAGGRPRAVADIATAMPLIRRALKLLADREVTPQLGLLKSTLLQLDSSFSERAYGAGSFRDFVEKLAKAGLVTLKGADRSFQVELREMAEPADAASSAQGSSGGKEPTKPHEIHDEHDRQYGRDTRQAQLLSNDLPGGRGEAAGETPIPAPLDGEAALAEDLPRLRLPDGFRIMVQAFSRSRANPRFPMYVRQFKQFMKTFDESFDERRYGFTGIVDALRFGQREGLFRLERDRQGGIRVHPGAQYLKLTQSPEAVATADLPAAGDSEPGSVPPLDSEAVAVQETPLDEDHASPTAEPPPVQAGAPSAPPDTEEMLPASASAVPLTEPGESRVEPTAAPRARGRKRIAASTGTRVKRTASATGGSSITKRKAARPRAKKP